MHHIERLMSCFQRGVSKGAPGSTAYRASGEIDPRVRDSPPKEIVNRIINNIESPQKDLQRQRCKFCFNENTEQQQLDFIYILNGIFTQSGSLDNCCQLIQLYHSSLAREAL